VGGKNAQDIMAVRNGVERFSLLHVCVLVNFYIAPITIVQGAGVILYNKGYLDYATF